MFALSTREIARLSSTKIPPVLSCVINSGLSVYTIFFVSPGAIIWTPETGIIPGLLRRISYSTGGIEEKSHISRHSFLYTRNLSARGRALLEMVPRSSTWNADDKLVSIWRLDVCLEKKYQYKNDGTQRRIKRITKANTRARIKLEKKSKISI